MIPVPIRPQDRFFYDFRHRGVPGLLHTHSNEAPKIEEDRKATRARSGHIDPMG
jgi:hypothetical protein